MERIHFEEAIHYITTVVYGRLPIFTRPTFIIPIIDSLNYYRYKLDSGILGYVVMLDHLHLLLWRQAEVEKCQEWVDAFQKAGAHTKRGEHKIWQDSFWDKIIYTEKFLRQKLNYIHRNPIRAGIITELEDYPYSSYRSYVHGDQTLLEIDMGWL